jgi:hypothetical protein
METPRDPNNPQPTEPMPRPTDPNQGDDRNDENR